MSSSPALHPAPARRAPGARPLWILAPLLIAALGIGAGCSRIAVYTTVDADADFASRATYRFLPEGGKLTRGAPPPPRLRFLKDPRYHAMLQETIGTELIAKGLQPVREEAFPDLLIGYHTIVRTQTDVLPPIYGVGWRGRVYVRQPGHVRRYKEGTLVIDLIDPESRHTIWRGVGVGAMRDMHPGAPLHEAIGEILKDFPPE